MDTRAAAQVTSGRTPWSNRARQIQLERDHLRLQIKTAWHMEQVYDILTRDWTTPTPSQALAEEASGKKISPTARIQEYRGKLEAHFKMINKVIPDQAAYQVDAQVETHDSSGPKTVKIVAFHPDDKPDTQLDTAKQDSPDHALQSETQTESKAQTQPEPTKTVLTNPVDEMPWLK